MPYYNGEIIKSESFQSDSIVLLKNRWIATSVTKTNYTDTFKLYLNRNDGKGFVENGYINDQGNVGTSIMTNKDNFIYLAQVRGSSSMYYVTLIGLNMETQGNSAIYATTISSSVYNITNLKVRYIKSIDSVVVAWIQKTASSTSIPTILYAVYPVNEDGTLTISSTPSPLTLLSVSNGYDINAIDIANNGAIFTSIRNTSSPYQNSLIYLDSSLPSKQYAGGEINNVIVETNNSTNYVMLSSSVFKNSIYEKDVIALLAYDNNVSYGAFMYSNDGGISWSTKKSIDNIPINSMTVDSLGNLYARTNKAGSSNRLIKSSDLFNTYTELAESGYVASMVLDAPYPTTSPLRAVKTSSKLLLYGGYTVQEIYPQPSDIGQVTDKNNILSYSITTDGTMSTITEKVNGTVVNTRNTTSGQAVQLGLTQAQWDAIRFGKYADVTGGRNTLTVEMGGEKWTYTFDKQLATDADIQQAIKATKDANEVYLPTIKNKLATAIGGSVSANADWLTMISAINGLSDFMISGTVTSSSTTMNFQYAGNTTTIALPSISASGLPFKPSIILTISNGNSRFGIYSSIGDIFYPITVKLFTFSGTSGSYTTYDLKGDVSPVDITDTSFTLPVITSNTSYTWYAIK